MPRLGAAGPRSRHFRYKRPYRGGVRGASVDGSYEECTKDTPSGQEAVMINYSVGLSVGRELPVYIVSSYDRKAVKSATPVYFVTSSYPGAKPVRVVLSSYPGAEPVRVVDSSYRGYPRATPVYKVDGVST